MRRRNAFTLVELLVVIGIIAVLISLLLPSLNSARRQAKNLKCLSNLRSIGQTFQLYAANNNRVYPVARHAAYATTGLETRWHAMLVPYITDAARANAEATHGLHDQRNMDMLQENSILWCPEWAEKGRNLDGTSYARTGYAMQVWPLSPVQSPAVRSTWSLITAAPFNGKYYRADVWGRKGSERLLIADGVTDYIGMSKLSASSSPIDMVPTSEVLQRTHAWSPFPSTSDLNLVDFWVDGARHGKAGTPKDATYTGKYFNALFCDGHAETVSVRQAWQAIVNPGGDDAGR